MVVRGQQARAKRQKEKHSRVRITEQLKIKALYDIWAFIDLVDFKGGVKNFSDCHKELCEFITEPELVENSNLDYDMTRALALEPRGHLKSTIGNVLFSLWKIYRNPNIRILVGTNVKELAWSFIREVRSYLEDRTLQEEVWNSRPHIRGPLIPQLDRGRRSVSNEAEDKRVIWSATALQVNRSEILKEPTIFATSVGSRVTGGHYDLLILDDIVDFRNTINPDQIAKVFDWVQDLESVLDPRRESFPSEVPSINFTDMVGDQINVLGTRYDRLDFYAYVLENAFELGFRVLSKNIYANGENTDDGYLWPERFNDNVVNKLRKRLTPKRFASQYLNTIKVDEEQPLKYENIQWVPFDLPGFLNVYRQHVEYFKYNGSEKLGTLIRIRPYLYCDPAISENKRADNTAIVVGGFDQYGSFYILDAALGKLLPDETARIIHQLAVRWKLNYVTIEQVGAFKSIGYTVKEHFKEMNFNCGVREYTPGRQKKKTRIQNFLQPYFNGRSIYMTKKLKDNEDIMLEVEFFPAETTTDDFLDTCAMIVEEGAPPPPDETWASRGRRQRAWRNSRYGGVR